MTKNKTEGPIPCKVIKVIFKTAVSKDKIYIGDDESPIDEIILPDFGSEYEFEGTLVLQGQVVRKESGSS